MSEPVKLDDWMLGTIDTLSRERDMARKQSQEWMQISAQSQVKLSEFLKLCAQEKGVNMEELKFDLDAKGFIPKST